MGDKTSDESDSDARDKKELVKVSFNNMDSSCDESDTEEQELPELRKSSEHRLPEFMNTDMKTSLYAKATKRLTIRPSSSGPTFNEQTATLREQDQMMLDCAKYGDDREYELMTLLVHKGANINSRDIYGNTGLHIGAKFGFLKIVETFLDRGLDIDTKGLFDNSTALILASAAGETAVVKLLLSRQANVEYVNKSGKTALTEAAASGYPDIVSLLIKHAGEDEKKVNQITGKITRQTSNVVEMLSGFKNPETLNELLIKAAGEGKGRLVSGLITAGADIETRSDGKDTGFHIAIKKGHECVVRAFLNHNVDINVKGDNDETALIMAVRKKKNFSTIKMLLDRGANINHQSKDGDTALIEAAKLDRMRAVCLLLERDADRNIKNNENKTALDISKLYSNPEVTFLLDDNVLDDSGNAQPDPNSRQTGMRALKNATKNGNIKVVNALLNKNVVASGKIKNRKGENIFQMASRLPQTREKEFEDYIEKIKKNKESMPEETVAKIMEDAKQISNELRKLFLAQPLFKHDQSKVSDRIFDITVNFIHEDFDEQHFGEDQKFYAKYDSKNKETLLEFVVNNAQWSNPGKERGTSSDFRVCPSLFGSNWVF